MRDAAPPATARPQLCVLCVCVVVALLTSAHAQRPARPSTYPSPTPFPRNGTGRCEGVRNYTVTMFYEEWKVDTFVLKPGEEAGYRPLLCVVHDERFRLWRINAVLPDPVKTAIKGNFTEVEMFLSKWIADNSSVYMYNMSRLTDEENKPVVSKSRDSVNITVDGSTNATIATCFSSYTPSPDWFVGFRRNLCVRNKTSGRFALASPEFKLRLQYSYDGGYNNQEQVGLPDEEQVPPNGVTPRFEMTEQSLGDVIIRDVGAAPSPTPSPTPLCFPAHAQVRLPHGRGTVSIDSLRPGDVVDGGNGRASTVFMMTHADAKIRTEFVRLHFSCGTSLTASGGHLVYRWDRQLIAMEQVRIGDLLHGDNGSTSHRFVTAIDLVWARGLFNPHTLSGSLVVDGVLVSAYTTTLMPNTAQSMLSLPRALYHCGLGRGVAAVASWAFGTGRLNSRFASLLAFQRRIRSGLVLV